MSESFSLPQVQRLVLDMLHAPKEQRAHDDESDDTRLYRYCEELDQKE